MTRKTATDPQRTGPEPRTALGREINDNLRRVYQEALEEPVPDRFTQLLAALRAKEGADKEGRS